MVMIYTSMECKRDCFEEQIVRTWKFKILSVLDQLVKTIIDVDEIGHKIL